MKTLWKTNLLLLCCLLSFALLPAAYSSGIQDPGDTRHAENDSLSRAEIIAIAQRYAEYKWRASPQNVLHGLDDSGNRVDTPDESYLSGGFVVDAENIGIPYQWGGFSSLEEFEEGIGSGKFAGHLPKKGSSPASQQAVGVDCSGLVSRCWDLPRKHSTRSLGNLCYELNSFDELQAGDIINRFDGHVVIFDSFTNSDRTKVAVYEAGQTRVEKNVYPVSKLITKGFKALRYKPLDARWTKQQLAPASFSSDSRSAGGFEAEEPIRNIPFDVTLSWRTAQRNPPATFCRQGDWARYKMGNREVTVRSVTHIDSEGILIRNRLSRSGKVQLTERQAAFENSWLQTLVEFAGFDQDFGQLKLISSQVTAGQFQHGIQTFEARQIELVLETTLLIRETNYPVTINLDCVISDQVPIIGLITARYEVEVRRGNQLFGKSRKQFELLEFFKG